MADLRIAFIGDSQGEALFPRLEKRLGQALTLLGIPHKLSVVFSRAQRGWAERNYQVDNTLPQQLADAAPNVVVIELGGNNSTKNAATYLASVRWMLDAARASGAGKIIWLGPAAATKEPFKGNKEWTRNTQSTALTAEDDVAWVDMFPFTATGQGADGVHFITSHYDKWATQLAKALAPLLREIPDSRRVARGEDETKERSLLPYVGGGIALLVVAGFLVQTVRARLLRPRRKSDRPLISNRDR